MGFGPWTTARARDSNAHCPPLFDREVDLLLKKKKRKIHKLRKKPLGNGTPMKKYLGPSTLVTCDRATVTVMRSKLIIFSVMNAQIIKAGQVRCRLIHNESSVYDIFHSKCDLNHCSIHRGHYIPSRIIIVVVFKTYFKYL